MKKIISILLAITIIFSCTKEDIITTYTNKSTAVDFTISTMETKTEYGDLVDNKWIINWTDGDVVKITNNDQNGESKEGLYTVSINQTDNRYGALIPITEADTVRWLEKSNKKQYFTIGYPVDKVQALDNYCTKVYYTQNVIEYAVQKDGVWNVTSNMDNLPLLGYKYIAQPSGNTKINFLMHNVTTTMDIIVQGQCSGNIPILGIVLQIDNKDKYIDSDGSVTYKYNIEKNILEPQVATNPPKNIYYTIKLSNPKGFVDLSAYGQMNFRLFIPGLDYTTGQCKLKVLCSGKRPSVNIESLTKPQRFKVILPNIPLANDNDWVEDIDDETLLNTLCIPGASQASSWDSDIKVQTKSINQLWDMGIRAFHFVNYLASIGYRKDNCDWGIYPFTYNTQHGTNAAGSATYARDIRDIWNKVRNTKEFAIIIERDGISNNSYENYYTKMINKLKNEGIQFVAINSNTKVKDVRGKIAIIRKASSFNVSSYAKTLANDISKIYNSSFYGPTNNNFGTLHVYSCDVDEDLNTLYSRMVELSKSNMVSANNAQPNNYYITNLAYQTVRNGSTTSDSRYYAQGAKIIVGDYLSRWFGTNASKGNLGIVLLPFIGERSISTGAETSIIYCDVFVQTLINQNF